MNSNYQEVTSVFPNICEIKQARLSIVVGRLLCSDMRDLLESETFSGRPIRWREGRGWIERTFEIIGPIDHIKQLNERIQLWLSHIQQRRMM